MKGKIRKKCRVIPGFGLSFGITLAMLGFIVVIPLCTLVIFSAKLSFSDFLATVTRPRVLSSYRVSLETALIAALIDAFMGTILAWVLVRYKFPGKQIMNGIIELPFALPTAVAGISLTHLTTTNGWIGSFFAKFGIRIAYTRVGIIVFEVKDFGGWIYGKGNQTKWTQVLAYGNEKYRFYNPIMQNNTHIKQLRQKLKENVPFYSVIVFYGDSELRDISFIPKGTFVTKWYRVIDVVSKIIQENPLASYKNKHRAVEILKEAVAKGDELGIESQHIENIKNMLGTDRIFQ